MNIKNTLLAIILLLSFLALGFSLYLTYDAWMKGKSYQHAGEASITIDLLLEAAQYLSQERALTNIALTDPSPAKKEIFARITNYRTQADAALQEAYNHFILLDFVDSNLLIDEFNSLRKQARIIRNEAERNLAKAQIMRDSKFLNEWENALSQLIIMSQDIRFAITQEVNKDDADLGRQAQMKHFLWAMGEYAAREQGIITTLLNNEMFMNETQLQQLAAYESKIDTSWNMVRRLSETSPANVKQSQTEILQNLFGAFKALKNKIYNAGIEGEPYPISVQTWRTKETKALQAVYSAQAAAAEETRIYINSLKAQSNDSLILQGSLSLLSVLMLILGFSVVYRKITKPLSIMTETMADLAGGNIKVSVPYADLKNELGEMAQAMQLFKGNALKRIELELIQKHESEKRIARAEMLEKLIESFDIEISNAIDLLVGLDKNATIRHSGSVLTNIQGMAAATEELSASFDEVSIQIQRTNDKIREVLEKTTIADNFADSLRKANNDVMEALNAIGTISRKTNLLSLNATIESARAGEAGKGFAVVAGEVKALAKQTDRSIQEIEEVMGNMQEVSQNMISSLNTITKATQGVSQASFSIASAVEEQTITTQEISKRMNQAVNETKNVSHEIKDNVSSFLKKVTHA